VIVVARRELARECTARIDSRGVDDVWIAVGAGAVANDDLGLVAGKRTARRSQQRRGGHAGNDEPGKAATEC
jgi:hypothetical protein